MNKKSELRIDHRCLLEYMKSSSDGRNLIRGKESIVTNSKDKLVTELEIELYSKDLYKLKFETNQNEHKVFVNQKELTYTRGRFNHHVIDKIKE